jgi:hypothetical protein
MIRREVMDDAAGIRRRFEEATPFPHVLVENFLEAAAAESLLRDFPSFDARRAVNEHGTVGRKAVLERVTAVSPFYAEFYRYINSRAFLDAMSALTGIAGLIADETLHGGGTHENLDGQGLDLHIDFNIDERRMLHRRVNLLIYLNKEWSDDWGGLIELHKDPWVAQGNEVRSFAPLFNHAVIFATSERSWHGFQQIALPPDRKHLSRKSFSIYLYTRERPAAEAAAPHTTFYVPQPLATRVEPGVALTQRDADAIKEALANRDNLLRLYQRLLVEKEQRLRDLLRIREDAAAHGVVSPDEIVLSRRTWRAIMALHRLKYRLGALRRRLGRRNPA